MAFAPTTLAFADTDCPVYELRREATGQSRIAVRIDGNWQFFAPNDDERPHVLKIADTTDQELCLAWEAPPYRRNERQIVYASTRYMDKQPILLYRNSSVAQIPILRRLFTDWERRPKGESKSQLSPDDAFREFHRVEPQARSEEPWESLARWHDTKAWRSGIQSHDLVGSATESSERLPYGTERLLVLAPKRPLTSWVRIITGRPKENDRLRVAISFSGRMVDAPRVHEYVFTRNGP